MPTLPSSAAVSITEPVIRDPIQQAAADLSALVGQARTPALEHQVTRIISNLNTIMSSTTNVWPEWNITWNSSSSLMIMPGSTIAEERRFREELEHQQRERIRKENEERAEANARAEKLLHEHLKDEQKDELRIKGFFHLYVGEKRYRINRGYAGNVELVNEKDTAVHRYCIHPSEQVPDADAMLAQKLLLEANEQEFLRVANRQF